MAQSARLKGAFLSPASLNFQKILILRATRGGFRSFTREGKR